MAVDYQKLDELIVKSIEGDRSSPLNDRDCKEEARRLEQLHGGEDFRYIDRRLQALRKAGKIAYLSRPNAPNYKAGWYLTPITESKG